MQNSNERLEMVNAGFWTRLFAFCIDNLIVAIGLLVVRLIMSIVMSGLEGTILGGNLIFHYTLKDIVVYISYVSYFILFTYLTGTTIGKKVMNLRVVNKDGSEKLRLLNVIYRETIGRFLCKMTVGIGYLLVGFHPQKCGIHDLLCDTKVIYAKTVKVYEKISHIEERVEIPTLDGYHLTDDEKIDIVDEVNIEENDLQ